MRVYDGANWIPASSAGGVSLILYEYTATSGQTTFSGADDNAATLSYTADNIQVVMNGIVLDPSDYTATNGTSVVLATGAAANDIVNIYAFKSFTVADTVSASAGGTFSANVAITGDLTVDTSTLKVDSSNNRVGIGTSSPSELLHLGGSNCGIRLEEPGGFDWRINNDGGNLNFSSDDPSAWSDKVTITNGGSVGIGTTSPSTALQVVGTFGNQIRFGTNTSVYTNVSMGTGYTVFDSIGGDSGAFDFRDDGTSRMFIDSSGKVLVGLTSSDATGGLVQINTATTGHGLGLQTNTTSTATHLYFRNPNGVVGSVQTSGSSTSYNTSSDHRLKQGVEDMTGAIDRVKALAPKRFNFIADPDTTVDGFLAHEAQAVVPEAVTGTHNEVDEDGNPVMQGIDQSKLVPLLTGALQEAIAKIEALETSNADLTARIEALENAS